ncbi:hypothetical protein F5890DRAFT_908922 [Lentinula detonsa]|uniref:Solute carrier family 40 member n=1 Tax=Lentinula detonsa TaxID=2804962 RepID=A0AA38PQR6_9AGAR|nr:hypothetical protein F5890DRAFT_908922 [Lentinula detonsa]
MDMMEVSKKLCKPITQILHHCRPGSQAASVSVKDICIRRRRVKISLYISHFLSTWNSRVFEFGAVLYLATIYPGTLLPMSIYARYSLLTFCYRLSIKSWPSSSDYDWIAQHFKRCGLSVVFFFFQGTFSRRRND